MAFLAAGDPTEEGDNNEKLINVPQTAIALIIFRKPSSQSLVGSFGAGVDDVTAHPFNLLCQKHGPGVQERRSAKESPRVIKWMDRDGAEFIIFNSISKKLLNKVKHLTESCEECGNAFTVEGIFEEMLGEVKLVFDERQKARILHCYGTDHTRLRSTLDRKFGVKIYYEDDGTLAISGLMVQVERAKKDIEATMKLYHQRGMDEDTSQDDTEDSLENSANHCDYEKTIFDYMCMKYSDELREVGISRANISKEAELDYEISLPGDSKSEIETKKAALSELFDRARNETERSIIPVPPEITKERTQQIVDKMEKNFYVARVFTNDQGGYYVRVCAQRDHFTAAASQVRSLLDDTQPTPRASTATFSDNPDQPLFTRQARNGQTVKVFVYQKDITKVRCDAVVNAANGNLAHGGGVAGALSRLLDYSFTQEGYDYVRRFGEIKDGDVFTQRSSGSLKRDFGVKYIINAVGPRYSDYSGVCRDDEVFDRLKRCLSKSMMEAEKNRCRSIALPAISSGIFGVPMHMCTQAYLESLDEFVGTTSINHLVEVHYTNIDDRTTAAIREYFKTAAAKTRKPAYSRSSSANDTAVNHQSVAEPMEETGNPASSDDGYPKSPDNMASEKQSSKMSQFLPGERKLDDDDSGVTSRRLSQSDLNRHHEDKEREGKSLTGYPNGYEFHSLPLNFDSKYDSKLENHTDWRSKASTGSSTQNTSYRDTRDEFASDGSEEEWEKFPEVQANVPASDQHTSRLHKTSMTGTNNHQFGLSSDISKKPEMEKIELLLQTASGRNVKVLVYQENITRVQCTAIVNSADRGLQHTYGVGKAIAAVATRKFQSESLELLESRGGFLKLGDVCYQRAGGTLGRKQGVQYVIHAVGPNKNDLNPIPILAKAVCDSLLLADENKCASVAIPAISAGANGVPLDLCIRSYWEGLQQYLLSTSSNFLTHIHFVNISWEINSQIIQYFSILSNTSVTSSPTQASSLPSASGLAGSGLANHHNSGSRSRTRSPLAYSGPRATSPPQHPTSTGSNLAPVHGHGRSYASVATPAAKNGQLIGFGRGRRDTAKSAADVSAPGTASSSSNTCDVCLDDLDPSQFKKLKCGHSFCKPCIDKIKNIAKSNMCPVCKQPFTTPRGSKLPGSTMTHCTTRSKPLGGYPHCGVIEITYHVPDGYQTPEHPNPGQRYTGTSRVAYLPDNIQGRRVLQLLQKAFDVGLIFTVGTSLTTGNTNTVVWNDIHHKTSRTGQYGYPDSNYMDSVEADLKARGITE